MYEGNKLQMPATNKINLRPILNLLNVLLMKLLMELFTNFEPKIWIIHEGICSCIRRLTEGK